MVGHLTDSYAGPSTRTCGETAMAKEKQVQEHRIDQFFSGPGARADNWRFLVEAAKAWSEGPGNRDRFDALFAQLEVMEEFHGYPGVRLMAALKEAAASGDA